MCPWRANPVFAFLCFAMWVGLPSWLPADADGLFSLVLACWLELLLVVVDLVGNAGGVAGVVIV